MFQPYSCMSQGKHMSLALLSSMTMLVFEICLVQGLIHGTEIPQLGIQLYWIVGTHHWPVTMEYFGNNDIIYWYIDILVTEIETLRLLRHSWDTETQVKTLRFLLLQVKQLPLLYGVVTLEVLCEYILATAEGMMSSQL